MLVAVVIIGSLGAAYFTRLLHKQGKKALANATGISYILLLLWLYYVFVVDVFGFGITSYPEIASFLYGKDTYIYVAQIANQSSGVPVSVLVMLAVVSFVALLMGVLAFLHGARQTVQKIYKLFKKSAIEKKRKEQKISLAVWVPQAQPVPLIRLFCRANC